MIKYMIPEPYAIEAKYAGKVTFYMHFLTSSRELFTYTLHLLSSVYLRFSKQISFYFLFRPKCHLPLSCNALWEVESIASQPAATWLAISLHNLEFLISIPSPKATALTVDYPSRKLPTEYLKQVTSSSFLILASSLPTNPPIIQVCVEET